VSICLNCASQNFLSYLLTILMLEHDINEGENEGGNSSLSVKCLLNTACMAACTASSFNAMHTVCFIESRWTRGGEGGGNGWTSRVDTSTQTVVVKLKPLAVN